VNMSPLMSTATIATGPVPSSRVMHWGTPGVQFVVESAYSTSSSPRSAWEAGDVMALPLPAIRPLWLRSERMRRVVAEASPKGIANSPAQPAPPPLLAPIGE
jgi:hypothetical protein